MNGDCTLQTERLELREICEEDTERIVRWRSDPQIYQYFRNPHALTVEEHLQWFRNKYSNDSNLVSWICWNEEEAIGVFQARKTSKDIAEVSYLLAEAYRGRGYAAEAVHAIEKWTAKHWNVKYTQAEIHMDNEKSREFIKRIGYVNKSQNGKFEIYEKTIDFLVK